jgi:hypothetical protein
MHVMYSTLEILSEVSFLIHSVNASLLLHIRGLLFGILYSSSLSSFCVMAGSTALTGIPIFHKLVSICFSSMYRC